MRTLPNPAVAASSFVVLGLLSGVVVGCAAEPAPLVISAPIPPTDITVVQRESELVPGSDRRLRVAVGDVTGGQVLVRIVDARTGREVLPQCSLRVCDAAELQFDGHRYGVVLKQMVNLLIGDDFVVLSLTSPGAVGRTRIDALLLRIATSPATFVRNGEDHDGEDAAAHLRGKWETASADVEDLDAFIDRVATRSSLTGEEYVVRLPGGRTVPLAEWLRDDG